MDKLREGQVDRLVVRDQDFHGRRITNASPSKDSYDYVVRKELDDALASFSPAASENTSTSTATVQRIYSIAKEGILAIQNDALPRLYIIEDKTLAVGLSFVNVRVSTAPTGASLTVIIKQNTTTWMTLTIAAAATSIDATNAQLVAAMPFVFGNYIRVDITAVGSTVPGSDLIVTIGI